MKNMLILPGWGMDEYAFSRLISKLSPDFNIKFVSWKNVKLANDFLNEALKSIDEFNQPCVLMGWSLGALVSIEAVKALEAKVKGLILISGTSCFTIKREQGYTYGVKSLAIKKMKKRLEEDKVKTVHDFIAQMFSEYEDADAVNFLKNYQSFMKYSDEALLAGLNYLISSDFRQYLSKINKPVLLLHGEKDKICPIKASEFMKDALKANLVRLPNAGHIPFFTQAEKVAGLINDYKDGLF